MNAHRTESYKKQIYNFTYFVVSGAFRLLDFDSINFRIRWQRKCKQCAQTMSPRTILCSIIQRSLLLVILKYQFEYYLSINHDLLIRINPSINHWCQLSAVIALQMLIFKTNRVLKTGELELHIIAEPPRGLFREEIEIMGIEGYNFW